MEHEKLGISSPDKGPWHAQEWPDGRIVLQSDDFEHDVALVVTGDFDGDKMHYTEQLAEWMNSNLTPSNDKGVGLDAAGGQSRTTDGLCHTGSK
jgi:hypothetical protein